MNVEVGNKSAVGLASVGSSLRRAGRVALWAILCLLLVRGVISTAAGPPAEAPAHPRRGEAAQAEDAFAIRFARAYLAAPTSAALAGYLADGVQLGSGRAAGRSEKVAQAEVSATEDLGGGEAVLTVACELRNSRTLYLAVPIVRSGAGEVAAGGAPWVVAAPTAAGVAGERPRPLAGEDAGEIAGLARRFLPAYLEGTSPAELSYFLAPGASVAPLGGELRFVALTGVGQLGSGEGARREVVARVRAEDRASGAVYPLGYRFELARGARWYVASVRGTLR